MENEDDLDLGPDVDEQVLEMYLSGTSSVLSSILWQSFDVVDEPDVLLPNLETGSLSTFFEDYDNNESTVSVPSTPEPAYNDRSNILPTWESNPVLQGSPSPALDNTLILTIPFGVSPVFASARDEGLLQSPGSFISRPRCASTSDIPDNTTKRQPRKRLTSEVDRKERRKESNRKAARKYRQNQRETAEGKQEDYNRVIEENQALRREKECLVRDLESIRNVWRCHSLVCQLCSSPSLFDPDS